MLNATPFLRLYARYRSAYLATLNPVLTQERELFKLIKKGAATKFGRDHGFSTISSVKEYQERVPLRLYEPFWNEY